MPLMTTTTLIAASLVAFRAVSAAGAVALNPLRRTNICLDDPEVGSDEILVHLGHLHSMTVDDLKTWFDPRFDTPVNFVPTVNRDLGSDAPAVLRHSPYPEYRKFKTRMMSAVDNQLMHIGDEQYGVGPTYEILDKLAHAAHMQEMYYHIREAYLAIKDSNQSISARVCDCLLDIDRNGLVDHFTAINARYRKAGQTPAWVPLQERQKRNRPPQKPLPLITDVESWKLWRNQPSPVDSTAESQDIATFLHCALRKTLQESQAADESSILSEKIVT